MWLIFQSPCSCWGIISNTRSRCVFNIGGVLMISHILCDKHIIVQILHTPISKFCCTKHEIFSEIDDKFKRNVVLILPLYLIFRVVIF